MQKKGIMSAKKNIKKMSNHWLASILSQTEELQDG
jgi:hypothetical protein